MAFYYVKSGSGVTEFLPDTAYALGDRIVPRRADVGSNYLLARSTVWECTTAGTSASVNPTWPATQTLNTTTVTSGTAVFIARQPGFSSAGVPNWSFALPYLDYMSSNSRIAFGDTVYISNNHFENHTANAVTVNYSQGYGYIEILCVNDSSAPPTSLATGAVIQTNGTFNISITYAYGRIYGLTLIAGIGSAATVTCALYATVLENCSIQMASTGSGSTIGSYGYLRNCTVKFGHTGQMFIPGGTLRWSGGSILPGSAAVTQFSRDHSHSEIENFDFSNAATNLNITSNSGQSHYLVLRYCKLPVGWTGLLHWTTALWSYGRTEMHACDAGTGYNIYRKTNTGGYTYNETTIVRTGGAMDDGVALSHKLWSLNPSGNLAGILTETPEFVRRVKTIGVPVTATVEFVHDSLTALKANEIWLEVTYISSNSSTLGAQVSSKTDKFSTVDTPASSATWVTTGLTNPNKRKLSVTFTPQAKGFIHARVFLSKYSTTAYVDPKITLS